jgi:N-glycosylase/DNA lyase
MTLAMIDRAVQALCFEVNALDTQQANWRVLAEEELLHEAAVCIFGSQTHFEIALAAANRARSEGLFRSSALLRNSSHYEARVVSALSKPLRVYIADRRRDVLPRFRNRLAALLAATIKRIYGHGLSFKSILASSRSAREARESLVEAVTGFGPKQASLYLRRVGFSSDLAILDTHILDYLMMARGVNPKPGSLSKLSTYEQIEREFRQVARHFGYAVGCVDLAMWVTMRVAKREALL